MKAPTQSEFVRLKTIVDIENALFQAISNYDGKPEIDGLLIAARIVSSFAPHSREKGDK